MVLRFTKNLDRIRDICRIYAEKLVGNGLRSDDFAISIEQKPIFRNRIETGCSRQIHDYIQISRFLHTVWLGPVRRNN